MDLRFSIDEWLPRFPLTPKYGHYDGEVITSPRHMCNNHQLREALADQVDWGPSVPVDVFVMADGEPSAAFATKIGGIPYRPSGRPWPRTKAGRPMQFFGQISFAYSKDITGEIPGDVLLVFGILEECEFATEWYSLGLNDLLRRNEVPADHCLLSCCHGNRFRTVSFPNAVWFADSDADRHPKCGELDVWNEYLLYQFQATQIGNAPFFIQEREDVPGRPLCIISSVQPDFHGIYPWVNRAEPLLPPEIWDLGPDIEKLMIDDMGCLYITLDEENRLQVTEQCY